MIKTTEAIVAMVVIRDIHVRKSLNPAVSAALIKPSSANANARVTLFGFNPINNYFINANGIGWMFNGIASDHAFHTGSF